jgi:Ca2+-transporting ATPase
VFGTLALFLWELNVQSGNIDKARTVTFTTLILFELFHAFNARSLHTTIFNKNFFKNQYIFTSVLLSFSLVLLSIYTSLGQEIFKTVPLDLADWIIILCVSSMVIVVSEVIKLLIKSEFEEQRSLQGVEITLE